MERAASAAANAWLARIAPADRLAADSYTHERLIAWVAGGLVIFVIAWLIQRSGILARLRDAIERETPRPWLAGAACAAAFTLIAVMAKAPLDAVFAWRGDQILHHGGGSFAPYLKDAVSGGLTLLTLAVVLAPPLQALMRSRPRTWWIWSGAALAAVIVALGWLPYALAGGPGPAPLPAGPMRDGLVQLVHDARIPAREVYVSPGGPLATDVTGGFGRARVTVSGDFARTASPAEVRAFVGHLMGHYAHGDALTLDLVLAGLVVSGLLAVQLCFRPVARLMGAAGLCGPGDPAAAPVVAVIALAVFAIAAPTRGAYIQWINVGADQFALDHSHEADGLALFLIHDWNHMSVDPWPAEQVLFYTHPPLKSRLRHAMAWKAAHGDQAADPAVKP